MKLLFVLGGWNPSIHWLTWQPQYQPWWRSRSWGQGGCLSRQWTATDLPQPNHRYEIYTINIQFSVNVVQTSTVLTVSCCHFDVEPQDISYIFANTFKKIYTQDVIGKDTLANLVKTKSGRSSFHAKYVEELQRVKENQ